MKVKVKKRTSIIVIIVLIIVIFSAFLLFHNNKKQISNLKLGITTNGFLMQNSSISEDIDEEIITEENSQYDSLDNGNIILYEYSGYAESVIVPQELDGHKIEEIDSNAFITSENLEMIKIPVEISENVKQIEGFEISENLLYEEYVVYITTKEYTEEYLKYIQLTEEEKIEWGPIPRKFVVTLDEDRNNQPRAGIATYGATPTLTTIPSKYNLKDKINISVENQGSLGICYAYATTKSIETNLALTKGITKNLSEIHLAVKSKQYRGGWFSESYNEYLKYGYGPIEEKPNTLLAQNYLVSVKDSNTVANNIYNACSSEKQSLNTAQEAEAIKALDNLHSGPECYVLEKKDFAYINGTKKKDKSYANEVIQNRNAIKQSIMNNGSVWTYIAGPSAGTNYKDYGDIAVQYQAEQSKKGSSYHAVSIIGWDDNFKATNFPSSWGVESNGAWLALNSWGSTWGNGDGTWWISYNDYYVETYNSAITKTSVEKIDVRNLDVELSTTSYTYTGNAKTPIVDVKYHDSNLDKGIDYTVKYSNNINVGTATVTITGQGNYTGTKTIEFTIKKADIKVNETERIVEYDGKQHEIVPNIITKLDSPTIKYGTSEGNYNLNESPKYKDVGTYKVYYKISCSNYNDFKGSTILTINSKSIKSSKLALDKEKYVYNGSEIKPQVIVKDGNDKLVLDKDYKINYSNNTNAGTATIKITGIGNYKETITNTFKIEKATPTYTIPSRITKVQGSKLKDVTLPKGFNFEDDLETEVGEVRIKYFFMYLYTRGYGKL